MRRLLLFEFVHADSAEFADAPASIRTQAWAMLEAVLTDAVALNDVDVTVLLCESAAASVRDVPAGVELLLCPDGKSSLQALADAAGNSDFVLPIAPEWNRTLLRVAETLQPLPCHTLLPSRSMLKTCSDKLETWKGFGSSSIPMVSCEPLCGGSAGADRSEPNSVFKPRWGAGCDGIRRGRLPQSADPRDYIRQPMIVGRSLSIGILGGPGIAQSLPVAEQIIVWDDNVPGYEGSTIPADLPHAAESRVMRITAQVIRQIGHFQGYIGLDFLLSESDGTVYLNEINPRLCTSYVGYREILEFNLLDVMLGATARPVLNAIPRPIAFRTDGTTSPHQAD
ncbi:MAG: ATP-grasp domain-containing protein [Planctomycetaceae bacterium]